MSASAVATKDMSMKIINNLLPKWTQFMSDFFRGAYSAKLAIFLDKAIGRDENDFIRYIEDLSDDERIILEPIIRKAMFSDSTLKINILVLIYRHFRLNNGMDYFHSALLNNLDSFSDYDFENILKINNSKTKSTQGESYIYVFDKDNKDHYFTLQKLINIACISDNSGGFTFGGKNHTDFNKSYNFYITKNFNILVDYIEACKTICDMVLNEV